MERPSQQLRDEHQDLRGHIEHLRTIADRVGTASRAMLLQDVEEALGFLMHHLIPHAEAENAVLYPTVARLMGSAEALDTMRFEHQVIGRMVNELSEFVPEIRDRGDDPEVRQSCRRLLYGLYATIGMHFETEESVLLPVLDTRLRAEDAPVFYEQLEAAAGNARHARTPAGVA